MDESKDRFDWARGRLADQIAEGEALIRSARLTTLAWAVNLMIQIVGLRVALMLDNNFGLFISGGVGFLALAKVWQHSQIWFKLQEDVKNARKKLEG